MDFSLRSMLIRVGYCSRPDFIIIGAQKGGTSALFSILQQHKHIKSSQRKELHYFNNDKWYGQRNLADYHVNFPMPYEVASGTKLFEATPMYLYHPDVEARLHAYKKDLRLIIVLRDPALRAFSAWTMFHHHFKTGEYARSHDPRLFDAAIMDELSTLGTKGFQEDRIGYVKRGIYHVQIEEYLKYFPKDQLMILENTELKKDLHRISPEIQSFIGVPFQELRHLNSNMSQVDERDRYKDVIAELKRFFIPHNEKLFDLLGKEYNWNKPMSIS